MIYGSSTNKMAPYSEYYVYKFSNTLLDLRSRQHETTNQKPTRKPVKRLQQFKTDYTDQFPTIVSSSRGIHYAHRTTCNSDFSIAASRVCDVSIHGGGPHHKAQAQAATYQRSMADFLIKRDNKQADLEHKTVSADMKFAHFVVEHNLSIAVADHVTKLLPRMFPDSEITQKFQCSQTKTMALIKMQIQTSPLYYVLTDLAIKVINFTPSFWDMLTTVAVSHPVCYKCHLWRTWSAVVKTYSNCLNN